MAGVVGWVGAAAGVVACAKGADAGVEVPVAAADGEFVSFFVVVSAGEGGDGGDGVKAGQVFGDVEVVFVVGGGVVAGGVVVGSGPVFGADVVFVGAFSFPGEFVAGAVGAFGGDGGAGDEAGFEVSRFCEGFRLLGVVGDAQGVAGGGVGGVLFFFGGVVAVGVGDGVGVGDAGGVQGGGGVLQVFCLPGGGAVGEEVEVEAAVGVHFELHDGGGGGAEEQ